MRVNSGASVVVQQLVAKAAASAIEYPPMQDPASFNLDAIRRPRLQRPLNRAKANNHWGGLRPLGRSLPATQKPAKPKQEADRWRKNRHFTHNPLLSVVADF